jgi:uncharacterized membrane protein YbhN (UPF0104 family)
MPEGSQVPGILESRRPTPQQTAIRVILSLLLVYLIFGVLIPSFADYEDVWAAITTLGAGEVVAMIAATLAIELAKSAAPAAVLPIGLWRAFLAQEAAAVVSNTIPGPSGTIARFATYTKYGVSAVDFGKSQVITGSFSNIIPLVLPTVAVVLLAVQGEAPDRALWLAVIGLAVSVVAIVLLSRIAHSEAFARRFGHRLGRFVNWARGLANRPPATEIANAVVRFRGDVLDTARSKWLVLTTVVLLKEGATVTALLLALRFLGADRADLTVIEVFAVYSVVRLLTLVEITPGNVGIAETLYISGLALVADTTSEETIVAAVLVFRMFTYLGPIVLGGGCWFGLGRYFRRQANRPPDRGTPVSAEPAD